MFGYIPADEKADDDSGDPHLSRCRGDSAGADEVTTAWAAFILLLFELWLFIFWKLMETSSNILAACLDVGEFY